MAHSLRLGRSIELLGGGAVSEVPQCAGAMFRLGNQFDFGTAQPVIDFQIALLGDGSRPVGERYDNRTFVLPVTIIVPSTGNAVADRLTLMGAREAIMQVISAEQFELIWSPDGQGDALNTVFECWRAKATPVSWDLKKDKSRLAEMQLEFEAMPFGRSDTVEQLFFDSPISGNVIPQSPVTVDDFSTVSSFQNNTLWSRSTQAATGSFSARWDHASSNKRTPLWYSHTISAADLSSCTKLTWWLGAAADTAQTYREWHIGRVHVQITLSDNLSRSITFGGITTVRASALRNSPTWTHCSLGIPQGKTFSYNNVTGYQVKVWNEKHADGSIEFNCTGYLSGISGEPGTHPKRPASERGGVYVINGVKGTAPTLLNLHSQLTTQDLVSTTKTIALSATPGQPATYTAPAENPNFLSADTGNGDKGGFGTWTTSDGQATNCLVSTSSAQFRSSPNSIIMTAIASATMRMASCSSTNIDSQGVPVIAGEFTEARAYARQNASSRTVNVYTEWFNSSKVSLGLSSAMETGADSAVFAQPGGSVKGYAGPAPSNTAYARLVLEVVSPVAGESHYFDDVYFSYGVQATVVCQAGAGGGGSVQPSYCGGGGGGGGEISWEAPLSLNAAATHSYTIGGGGVATLSGSKAGNGGDTGFQGRTTLVLAHGGIGGNNSTTTDKVLATGGAGGTGSVNGHHFNGGAGGQGTFLSGKAQGGGGGGGAGDGGAGGAAPNVPGGAGGAAGALSIPGGRGNTGGYGGRSGVGGLGFAPSGGGGGAATQGSGAYVSRNGAPGQLKLVLKTYNAISLFSGLLLHMLPSGPAAAGQSPVISVGAGQDTPDGTVEYTCPPVENMDARYNGTFSVMLCAFTTNGAGARTWTVTIRHYEATGGAVSSVTVSASVDPASLNNLMVNLGEVSLPVKDMPDDNIDSYFTVVVQSSNTADRFNDVLLLDTRGQLAFIDLAGSGYSDYFIDAPDRAGMIGRALGTVTDRSAAVSVLANTLLTGGPFRLLPGTNLLMVYSPGGQPALEADYQPRWWFERLEA